MRFSNSLVHPCESCLFFTFLWLILVWDTWRSHNFRPSYMRLRASLLRAKLNVDCILAMTATATNTTLHAVMSALEIPQSNLVQTTKLRDGLQLSVSASSNRSVQHCNYQIILDYWQGSYFLIYIITLNAEWRIWWLWWSRPLFVIWKASLFTANFRLYAYIKC